MIYRFSRGLQVLGMIVLPMGMAGNIARPEQVTVQDSLAMAGLGMGLFAAGWILQQFVNRK